MGLLTRAAIFCFKELVAPTLSRFGEHVGDAYGKVVAAKINPGGEPLVREGEPEPEEGEIVESEEPEGDDEGFVS